MASTALCSAPALPLRRSPAACPADSRCPAAITPARGHAMCWVYAPSPPPAFQPWDLLHDEEWSPVSRASFLIFKPMPISVAPALKSPHPNYCAHIMQGCWGVHGMTPDHLLEGNAHEGVSGAQERQADGLVEGCQPCGLTCQRQRPCGHACPLKCHTSDCPPCQEEVQEACHCGRSTVTTTCCTLQQV